MAATLLSLLLSAATLQATPPALNVPPGVTPGVAPHAAWRLPDALANIFTERKLRRLHLVRPDLINLPLRYEVYC